MEFQKELFRNEMIEQKQWEQEELAKEREFQREQTSLILNAFNKSMQGIRPQIPASSTQSTLKPLKLIPVSLVINFSNIIINHNIKTNVCNKIYIYTYICTH